MRIAPVTSSFNLMNAHPPGGEPPPVNPVPGGPPGGDDGELGHPPGGDTIFNKEDIIKYC